MTDAEVQTVVELGKVRGITPYEAATYLMAKEILAVNPDDRNALAVIENFLTFMKTGERVVSFAEFALPLAETDEELEASAARRAAYLVAKGKAAC